MAKTSSYQITLDYDDTFKEAGGAYTYSVQYEPVVQESLCGFKEEGVEWQVADFLGLELFEDELEAFELRRVVPSSSVTISSWCSMTSYDTTANTTFTPQSNKYN